jgi:preprotein translocase subunit SecD
MNVPARTAGLILLPHKPLSSLIPRSARARLSKDAADTVASWFSRRCAASSGRARSRLLTTMRVLDAAALIVALTIASVPVSAFAAPRMATAEDNEKLRAKIAAYADQAIETVGGSRILFQVDAVALGEAMVTDLRDDVYRIVRADRIPFAGLAVREGGVELKIADGKNRERVVSELMPSTPATSWRAGSVAVSDEGEGLIRLTPTNSALAERLHGLVEDSMNMIEQRLHNGGIREVATRPEGADRISVLLPGVTDTEPVTAILGKKAHITFRLVDVSMTPEEALQGNSPPGSEVLYNFKDKTPYLVLKESVIEGDDIGSAAAAFGPNDQPIVSFRFNARGTRRFAHITADNVDRPFAVVIDDKVISAPVIREPIVGGSGQISGGFTLEEANTVAALLLSGALPGRLSLVAQQVVGPAGHGGKQSSGAN